MNFLGKDDREELIIQMTSMVDIAFILLSFFVLASRFSLGEQDVGLGYTQATLSAGASAEDFPQNVPVQLQRRGATVAITVGEARLPDGDFRALRAKLARINMPDIPVTLLAEPDLSVDQVSQAMDAVLSSPMKKLSVGQLQITTASDAPAGAGAGAGS